MYRYSVFKSNFYQVEKHNEESYASNDSDAVFLELNKFSDLTLAEFKSMYMGRRQSVSNQIVNKFDKNTVSDLPDSVDWRTKGAVTNVKD